MKSVISILWAGLMLAAVGGCSSQGNTAHPTTDTVIISGMKFQPESLTINKGDTVIWINEDIVSHNVTEQPDNAWASDTLASGQSWKRVLDQSTDYYCSIHPTMKAKIVVRK